MPTVAAPLQIGQTDVNAVNNTPGARLPQPTSQLTTAFPTLNTTSTGPKAAISSNTAATHLSDVKTGLNNLNTDVTNSKTPVTDTAVPTDTSTTPPVTSNDAINSILDELGKGVSDTNKNQNDQISTDQSQISDLQTSAASDSAAIADVQAKIQSVQNGTYPLSAIEQQAMSSIYAGYTTAVSAQMFANQGALGQMTQLMASLGIESSAPVEAIGLIHNTISTGIDKIANLTTKMSTAVSNLALKIQTNDLNGLEKSYSALTKSFNDRTTAIQKLQTDVANLTKQQQTAMTNYAKTATTDILNSSKIDAKAKTDAATQLYHAGLLSAKDYANVTARIKAGQAAVKKGLLPDAPTSQTFATAMNNKTAVDDGTPRWGSDGYMNPVKYQQAFDQWVQAGYSPAQFVKEYPIRGAKTYINPANTWLVPYVQGVIGTPYHAKASSSSTIQ